MKIWIQFPGLGRKMGRLELGLGLEVLRFRTVLPPRKNNKRKGCKTQEAFLPY